MKEKQVIPDWMRAYFDAYTCYGADEAAMYLALIVETDGPSGNWAICNWFAVQRLFAAFESIGEVPEVVEKAERINELRKGMRTA
jgi:hypothetical protein